MLLSIEARIYRMHPLPKRLQAQANIKYPLITEWLEYCDRDEIRKRGERNFSQFARFFVENDYKFLDESWARQKIRSWLYALG